MTLALALLPFAALLTLIAGLSAVPFVGLLTALSIVFVRQGGLFSSAWPVVFAAVVALAVAIVPVVLLAGYEDDSTPSRKAAALILALLLLVAANLTVPVGDVSFVAGSLPEFVRPVSVPAVTVALGVTFAGLATMALRSGIRRQLAGVLMACDGVLLSAVNTPDPSMAWLVGACVLLVAGAGTWLARRLSLLRERQAPRRGKMT
ncbi:hypothetical protein [Acetobacter estunensis]|uniref:hypothetical protein n=1 Tax=Acetobacter estunensis TaxID=104097 RepID=UPI001C2D7036|nr:hypothetical protein [Acetobacter estunensis]MBV1838323.1 hypothetical protein [Acetobacter estunensis]